MKQIGKLSAEVCPVMDNPLAMHLSAKIILKELASILKIRNLENRANVLAIRTRYDVSITINEEHYSATIEDDENPNTVLEFIPGPTNISKLKLLEIQNFKKVRNRYVLPSTIKENKCATIAPCPVCTEGKCQECNGSKYIKCDACEGSKKCSACNGTGRYPCYYCRQTGECSNCHGTGEIECYDCDGIGWVWEECRACHGSGRYTLRNGNEVDCRVCRGTGRHHKEHCWTCDGTGSVNCNICDGSGDCEKCAGESNVECRACHGTGTCGKCSGSAKLKCRNCNGSGFCPSCRGSNTVPCHRCLGTGKFQTYKSIKLNKNQREIILYDKNIKRQFQLNINQIGKTKIYSQTPYTIDFGKSAINDKSLMDILSQLPDPAFMEKMLNYRNTLFKKDGSPSLSDENFCKSSITIEQFPLIKCEIEYSNERFTFFILGTDCKVYADKLPTFWDKLCAWFVSKHK